MSNRSVNRAVALAMSLLTAAGSALAADPVSPGVRILTSADAAEVGRIQEIPPDLLFSGDVAAAISPWTSDIVQVAELSQERELDELQPPASLVYRSSRDDRFLNAEAADKLKYTLFRAVPDIIDGVEKHVRPEGKDISLDAVLTQFRTIVEDKFAGGDGVADVRDKMEAHLLTQWDGMRSGVKLDDFRAGGVLGGAQDFMKAFQSKKDRFQGRARDMFSKNVRTGAAFGNLGSRMILSSLGLKPASPQAVLALTLLHPITDDALDRGADIRSSLPRITSVLEGQKLRPANPFEQVVFSLIGDIFDSFRPADHPVLQQILVLLHQAQLESVQVQKDGGSVDRRRLLELTSRKGGLTSLALAYVSMGSLRKDEVEFFYKTGMLFQLGDDLMDVAEDKVDGTTTLWTLAVGSKKTFRQMMQLFFDIQQYLEASSSKILAKNSLKAQLGNDLRLGFRFYFFASLLNKDLDRLTKSVLKQLTPLSPRNIRSIAFSLFKDLKKASGDSSRSKELAETIDFYGRVFDRHFLNGAYGRFEEFNRSRSALSTYWITDPNPWFLIVKFGNRCEEFFARCFRSGPAKEGTPRVFADIRVELLGLAMLGAYVFLPRLIHHPGLGLTAAWAEMIGVIFFMFDMFENPAGHTPTKGAWRAKLVVPFLALGLNAWLFVADVLMR